MRKRSAIRPLLSVLLLAACLCCILAAPRPAIAQNDDQPTTPTVQIISGFDEGLSWKGVRETARNIWKYRLVKVHNEYVELNQIVMAILVLFVGIYMSRRLSAFLGHVLVSHKKLDANRSLILEHIVFYSLLIVAVLFSLQIGGIPITIFAFLGGAVAIGIGFGAQNIFNNFISGLILMFEQPVRIGDLIEVDADLGQVANIGARCTRIRRVDGIEMLVPNSKLLENTVVNRTLSDRLIRTSVIVGVAYGSPTRQVAEIIGQVAKDHPDVLGAPPPQVIFNDFGDSSLVFEVYFWADVRSMMQLRKICSDLRFEIDDRFREAGITIAFPQRDVHLDSIGPVDVRVLPSEPQANDKDLG